MRSVCRIAVPDRLIAQGGCPSTVAVAFALQAMLLVLSVPLAEPEICTLPKQVALNVPDPVVPLNEVTAQLKFVHDCDGFAPGTCAIVTHVPVSDAEPVGLVTVLALLKQPAETRAADATRARIRFMVKLAFREYL